MNNDPDQEIQVVPGDTLPSEQSEEDEYESVGASRKLTT